MLILAILTVTFVFNIRHWESLGFKRIDTAPEIELTEGLYPEDAERMTALPGEEQAIIFSGFNQKVENIELNIKCLNQDWVSSYPVKIMIKDEGWAEYYDAGTAEIIRSQPGSRILRIHSAGVTQAIKISFEFQDYAQLQLSTSRFNVSVPFHFSFIRFILILFLGWLLLIFHPDSPSYQSLTMPETRKKNISLLLLATVLSLFFASLTFSNPELLKDQYSYSQEYQKLAESLSKGQTALADQPSDLLKQMENPYDYSMRISQNVDFLWDHAYYQGKYYVYFGVGPVILYYLSYYLLTGQHLPNYIAILISQTIFIFSAVFLLYAVCRRFFKKIPFLCVCLLSCTVIFGSGAFMIARHPDIYSVPIITGLAFTGLGLLFWVCSKNNGKIHLIPLTVGSVCMAFVAACRPQLVFASFFAIPLFWDEILNLRTSSEARKALIAALIPYGIAASFLMFYNHLRFGSPFDFGANYNLTTNDMTKRGFIWDRIGEGIYYYLLQPPMMQPDFPFLSSAAFQTSYIGMIIAEPTYGGLFSCNIILLINMLLFLLKSWFTDKKIFAVCCLSLMAGIITVMMDIQMAGILQRYFADFSIFFFIPAVLIILSVLDHFSDRPDIRNQIANIIFILCLLTIGYQCLLFLIPDQTNLMTHNPDLYYRIKTLMQWW